jgi:hypothetical protein
VAAPFLMAVAIFGVVYRASELWRGLVDQQQDAVFVDHVATFAEYPIAYVVAIALDLALLGLSLWLLWAFARMLQRVIYTLMKPTASVS